MAGQVMKKTMKRAAGVVGLFSNGLFATVAACAATRQQQPYPV